MLCIEIQLFDSFVLLWSVCCGVLLDVACEWFQHHSIELPMWSLIVVKVCGVGLHCRL
jgi:hypothetical protein